MKLHLVDINPLVASALERAFESYPEVSVSCGDILAVADQCVVSPANGYGYMDGGVDAEYRVRFGGELESRVRDAISRRPEGYLPVGASLVVATGDSKIPFIIVAPTMIMPEAVDVIHSGRAMRAILRAQSMNSATLTRIFCPGLGTGVGEVSPEAAANSMATAYSEWKKSLLGVNQARE